VLQEEVFDCIDDIHRAKTEHPGQHKTYEAVKERYHNITREMVKIFIESCPHCIEKAKKDKFAGAIRPITSCCYRERFQVDLIDNREKPKMDPFGTRHSWLVVCKDHFTGLTACRPVPRKKPEMVAYVLTELFGLLGFPLIYQSDNGKEVASKLVLDAVKKMNPSCTTMQGRPRTPRDQGSVESTNKMIKHIIATCESEDRAAGKEPNWTLYCGRIMTAINGTKKQSDLSVDDQQEAYEIVFGVKYHEPAPVTAAELNTADNVVQRMLFLNDADYNLRLRNMAEVDANGGAFPDIIPIHQFDPEEFEGIDIHSKYDVVRRMSFIFNYFSSNLSFRTIHSSIEFF
jgi:Integrase zinc binding domain